MQNNKKSDKKHKITRTERHNLHRVSKYILTAYLSHTQNYRWQSQSTV